MPLWTDTSLTRGSDERGDHRLVRFAIARTQASNNTMSKAYKLQGKVEYQPS